MTAAAVGLKRVSAGHYQTPDGRFDILKQDGGFGPSWRIKTTDGTKPFGGTAIPRSTLLRYTLDECRSVIASVLAHEAAEHKVEQRVRTNLDTITAWARTLRDARLARELELMAQDSNHYTAATTSALLNEAAARLRLSPAE